MKTQPIKLLSLLILMAVACSCQHSPQRSTQSTSTTSAVGKMTGTVKDNTGKSIPGVAITISSTTAKAPIRDIAPLSNSEGEFIFKNLPPGDYVFKASHASYRDQTKNVTITGNDVAIVDFTLESQ